MIAANSPTHTPLWVVGNQFTEFANNPNIISFAELKCLAKNEQFYNPDVHYCVYPGQGVDLLALGRLSKWVRNFGNANLTIALPKGLKKATCAMTGVKKSDNILVSEPLLGNAYTFRCALLFQDSCKYPVVSKRGQHLAPDLLIEAARQMMVSVICKMMPGSVAAEKKHLIHSMRADMVNPVFPLPVSMECHIRESGWAVDHTFRGTVAIRFLQNGKIAATVDYAFSVPDHAVRESEEADLASDCIRESVVRTIDSVSPEPDYFQLQTGNVRGDLQLVVDKSGESRFQKGVRVNA